MLKGSVSDYGTLNFSLYPDSHLSKEEQNPTYYIREERKTQERTKTTDKGNKYMSMGQTVY